MHASYRVARRARPSYKCSDDESIVCPDHPPIIVSCRESQQDEGERDADEYDGANTQAVAKRIRHSIVDGISPEQGGGVYNLHVSGFPRRIDIEESTKRQYSQYCLIKFTIICRDWEHKMWLHAAHIHKPRHLLSAKGEPQAEGEGVVSSPSGSRPPTMIKSGS